MQPKRVERTLEELSPVLEELFKEGLSCNIQVTGNSMLPLWRDRRDQVTLAACDATSLKKMDLVLYQRENGQYILHRILQISHGYMDLCGDAQETIEEKVPVSAVRARVIRICRDGHWFSCDHVLYRSYSLIWFLLRPVRGKILGMGSRMKRLVGKR